MAWHSQNAGAVPCVLRMGVVPLSKASVPFWHTREQVRHPACCPSSPACLDISARRAASHTCCPEVWTLSGGAAELTITRPHSQLRSTMCRNWCEP